MAAKIVPLLPNHKTYVEPFGGGASILLAKPPSPIEVYNDLDRSLYAFFTVLADPDLFGAFFRRVALLPYHRTLYNECRKTWSETDDPVERAALWFVVARQSFAGFFGSSWGSIVTLSSRGMAETVSGWLSAIERLPEIHARLQRVQFECADWRVILERYDTPETLFYCDPPYVPDTRHWGEYSHEMAEQDHTDLVTDLLQLSGAVVLSGYPHSVYDPLEAAGWERVEFETACSAAGRTRASGLQGDGAALEMQPRTECVWRNPVALAKTAQQLSLGLFCAV